jgi:DNA topoisomerase IA
VTHALEHPREVDAAMVDSALVRRFLDRLVGFRTSSMARTVVPGASASMGRVQTPTLGFVVDRELEREAHVPIPYFETRARAFDVPFGVRFHEPDDPDAWRDEGGKVDPQRTFSAELATAALEALEATRALTLSGVQASTRRQGPRPAFSTDAILQAAGSRFGWSPRKTSALASMLYEEGHITYIRTDSTRLAASAVAKAREVVTEVFGDAYLGDGAREVASTGPTQDAHEAIRPTRLEVAEVAVDDADARRLYRLIRAQTLASQMAPATTEMRRLEARCEGLDRILTGNVSWETFSGWRAAFSEFDQARPTSPPDVALEEGARWPLDPATEDAPNPVLIEDETRPPGRYRPHTLIKAMKDAGIGRPSTYSRTVEKLEERSYVVLEEGALVPTERGRAIWLDAAPLYVGEAPAAGDDEGRASEQAGAGAVGTRRESDGPLPPWGGAIELFSPEFTAYMEAGLDAVASGHAPAPATWEAWRDQVRELHDAARKRRDTGTMTLRTRERLERMLENTPDEVRASELSDPLDLDTLAERDAKELIARLEAAGVKPAPSSRQVAYLHRLVEDLAMDEAEAASHGGASTLAELRTQAQVSQVIDELQRIFDERRPPSARQRRFVEDLAKQLELTEADATGLVGVASFDELTGGREGTASELIEALKSRLAEQARATEPAPQA